MQIQITNLLRCIVSQPTKVRKQLTFILLTDVSAKKTTHQIYFVSFYLILNIRDEIIAQISVLKVSLKKPYPTKLET